MTTYRLPEKCGSIEVVPVGGCTEGCTDEVVVSPVGAPEIELTIAWKHLVKVAPPLPEEPTDLGFYFLNPDKGDGFLVERQLDGWSSPVGLVAADSSWEQLHEDYPCLTLMRLIPAPTADPTSLPWTHRTLDDDDLEIRVETAPNGEVCVRLEMEVTELAPTIDLGEGRLRAWAYVPADDMARALWTADAVRERAS